MAITLNATKSNLPTLEQLMAEIVALKQFIINDCKVIGDEVSSLYDADCVMPATPHTHAVLSEMAACGVENASAWLKEIQPRTGYEEDNFNHWPNFSDPTDELPIDENDD